MDRMPKEFKIIVYLVVLDLVFIGLFNGRFNNEVQHFRKQERKRYTKVLWKRDISI